MSQREYEISKGLRLFRTAAERKAAEQAERLAIDARLWPKQAKKAQKLKRAA
jgi:hypothetical protein